LWNLQRKHGCWPSNVSRAGRQQASLFASLHR
jgi:hypothetical protein